MKTRLLACSLTASLLLALAGVPFHARAQSPAPVIPLRLEVHTNGLDLVVSSVSSTGALFIQQSADLPTLLAAPAPILQTNTPLTNALRLAQPPGGGSSTQAFFSALFWPGRSVDEFGDPEDYPVEPVPDMVLFTTDLPPNLGTGQVFTVDFFVADPTGQPVSISGTATILVVRESDGAAHPDATVTPSSALMTNGFMRVMITVDASAPLDGYTLALSVAPELKGSPRPKVSNTFLKTSASR
jgi:hypothetical protein